MRSILRLLFPYTHIFAIWLDDCRVLQHFERVSIALPSFALLGARAGWQLTASLPACSGSGPSCRPYIYVCMYIILTLPRSCRNGHSWLLTVARCGRALSSLFESSGYACVPVRVCVCARGEKCDVNTSENETRKEKKNEKPEHKPETSSTIPRSHDSIIVICCDSRLWRTCLRWKKRKT